MDALETYLINELQEDLQCTVCLEPLKDPRTLPCFHSFCKDCLQGVVKTCRDEAPRGRLVREFPCPYCREMFTLDPDKNVADMKKNHFICNMVKARALFKRDRGTGVKDEAKHYTELQRNNETDVELLEGVLNEGNAIVKRLTSTAEELDRHAKNAKSKIVQRKRIVVRKVLEMLNKHTETLLDEVDQIHKGERAKLNERTGETKQYVENIQKSVQLLKKLVDEGSEEEIISSQKIIRDSAKNLFQKRQEYFKQPVTVENYTLITSDEPSNEEISQLSARCLGITEGAKKERPKTAAGFVTDIDSDLYDYLKSNHPAQLSLALKEPQPSIETRGDLVHFSFSSEATKEHFLNCLKEYKWEIVPINSALLEQGLKKELQEIFSMFDATSVSFIERYDEGFLKLVGRAVAIFDTAEDEMKKCIAKAEERTNRRVNCIELLPVHLKLLQHSTKFQSLETSLKRDGLEIIQDEITGKIIVKGSSTQIQKFKNETQDIIGLFEERPLNENRFSLLKANKAISHVKSLLTAENSFVEVLVDYQGRVTLHGMQKTHVDRAYDIIVNAIIEIKLPEGLRTKSSQDALLNKLGTSTPLILLGEDGDPRIICFKKHSRNLNAKIDDFKERKKTVEQKVPLQKAVVRYLSLYGRTTLDGLRLSSPDLKIEIGNGKLVLSGEKPVVEYCCGSIQDFTKDLKLQKINYGTPETASSITEMAIESIERKHRCGIVVTVNDEPERPGSFRSQTVSPVHSAKEDSKRTLQCRYTFPNGKIIEVHQGDILSHPVDYLVNSANDELKHSGGLARAIVEKGGSKIQEECFRALNDLGTAKLLPGNVVPTDGGKLLCKEILHVVVPTYCPSESHANDGDETREETYLRHCCTNVLERATNGQTIAIPALGTGIYRIPHDISAKSLVAATCEFLQENPYHSLRQVHFVDNDPAAIQALMKEILTRFRHDLNLHINEPVRDRWRPLLGAYGGVSSPDTTSANDDMTFQTPEGMEIRLVVGNIAKSTTDVIVNTVGKNLNLSRNPCSKAILDEAGNAMKIHCEKWIKDIGQVKEGDFAITDSAKLKCKKVFHVVCPKWTPDQGEKKLREVVQKLLSKAEALSLTSISIPALGTGTRGFSEILVAKILFEEATKFSSNHKPSPKIKTFNVVVYKGNTKAVDAFKEQFHVFSPTTDRNAPKTKQNTEGDGGILKTSRKKISNVLDRSSSKEKNEVKTQDVEVEVVQGNIVEESTDAIGFLVSENITQGGQIGTALFKGAGDSLRQEYKTLSKIYPGTVVMTTAGNLKVRKLLHMVIKAPTLGTDKTMIQNAVTKCLEHADIYGFTSLSLPAVGTGHLRKDGKQSAEILYHCIKEYRKRDDKSLKLIRIVILQENLFEEFNKIFARKDTGAKSFKASTRKTPRQRITVEIAAESLNEIAKIEEALKRVEAEQCHSEIIETLQKIDERELAQIMYIQDLHDVRIECEPNIGYIRISGLARNVSIAAGKTHNIIHDWERERHHTDVTVKEVEWFYYEDNQGVVIPEKYVKGISAKIEAEYKRNSSGTVVVGDEEKYKIDFKTMTETCLTSSQGPIKVYRRPCEAFPFPDNWEYQPVDASTGQELQVFRFNIEKQDTEYTEIHDMFKASLSSARNVPETEVVKIERIQNPGLYQLYQGKKNKMSNGGNEMLLYHGTAKDAVEKINCTGFNRSYYGKMKVLKFGNGVYFARGAWYSSRKQYAVPDDKGLQYMYIAKVLVGKYTKGKEGLIEPPPIDASNPNVIYDSVVDNVTNPLIYVVFYDYQHYPEYLITFKAKSNNELPPCRSGVKYTKPTQGKISEEEKNTWFEDTFLNSDYKLKKKIHKDLRSFSWLCGAYGLCGPNRKIHRQHIYVTVKRGMKKPDVRRDLEEKFNCDAKDYFELLQEPKKTPKIKFLVGGQNTPSVGAEASSSATPVLPKPGCTVAVCSGQTNHNPVRVREENEKEEPDVQGRGTLTMFCCRNGQHYALTCFHVASACDLGCLNAAFNKADDIKQMRNEVKSLKNQAKEKLYYFTERKEENNNEAMPSWDDESNYLKLGHFEDAYLDTECDIMSLKILNDVQHSCEIADVTSPDWDKMQKALRMRVLKKYQVNVEKNGYSSALGYIVACDFSYSVEGELLFKDAHVVGGYDVPFLKDGDSGSLVFFHDEENVKQVFAYAVCEVDADLLPKIGEKVTSSDSDSDNSSTWSDDSDDSDDKEIVFQNNKMESYSICLSLHTALKKLGLLDAACFNDCANKTAQTKTQTTEQTN